MFLVSKLEMKEKTHTREHKIFINDKFKTIRFSYENMRRCLYDELKSCVKRNVNWAWKTALTYGEYWIMLSRCVWHSQWRSDKSSEPSSCRFNSRLCVLRKRTFFGVPVFDFSPPFYLIFSVMSSLAPCWTKWKPSSIITR